MALYDVVDGIYRKVAKKYDPVEGVYRKVQKAFDPVDGVYRQYYSGGTPVGTLAVGDSVWLNVDGVQTEFLVVHQGNPDSALYDASCDGTWLLIKDLYEGRAWDSSNNNYENSDIHAYLNGTFLGMFDKGIQYAIKQVKIPYVSGTGKRGETLSGSSGMSTKIFLLSIHECNEQKYGEDNLNNPTLTADGACLDYFNELIGSNLWKTRIAYYNGTAQRWWLRSPCEHCTGDVYMVDRQGMTYIRAIGSSDVYLRPAFILDSDTAITQADGKNIIA